MAGREIRTGFVGAGYIASWHAEALASAGARLVAVCDPALSAAEGLAGRYGATAYGDLGQMLAEAKLDAVHILTPPALHAEHALAALAAGAHVLVEKPFALTSEDAAAMVAAAKAAGKVIAVNHNFLTLPGYGRLRAALAAGVPGRLDWWIFAGAFRWHRCARGPSGCGCCARRRTCCSSLVRICLPLRKTCWGL